MKTSVEFVLRTVAVLILVVVALEYLLLDVLMVPPLIVAGLLVGLSFVAIRLPRTVAIVSILLSILVPLGAVMGYLSGQLVVLIPIFDVLVFGWLLWVAVSVLRKSGGPDAHVGSGNR